MQPRVLVTAAVAALLLSSALALSASATSVTNATMGWTISQTGQTGSANMANLATCNSTAVGGNCALNGWTPGHGLYTVNSWTSTWDSDPFTTNNLNVTNNSTEIMTFDVLVTTPVILTGPQTAMSGSVGVTLTNTPTGTASLAPLSSTPAQLYSALIDGAIVRGLFPYPDALSCAAALCSASATYDFGVSPASPEIGPQANTNIAIRLRFNLSPGDSAGITSVFNIVAVPEPGAAALLGLGLLVLAVAGRRRA